MATHLNGSAASQLDASAAREEALMLLRRLEADRAESEARLVELGRSDPIKDVTGKSSLDRAIEEARAMVAALDELAGGTNAAANGRSQSSRDNDQRSGADRAPAGQERRSRPEFAGATPEAQLPGGEGGFDR